MRPIKLTMEAFGPYAQTEIIEFDTFNGEGIFLITGPTGAGKTTIFDAIIFALLAFQVVSLEKSMALEVTMPKMRL